MASMCRCVRTGTEETVQSRPEHISTEDLAPVSAHRLRMLLQIGSEVETIERIEELEGIYEGAIHQNDKHGIGCYLWYNGNFYNGNWEHGRIEGHGTLYYANGGVLKGTFIDGKLEGLGRGLYQNGDMYVGLWKDGMFHGKGLFYMKSCNRWQLGEFEHGSTIRIINSGNGKPSSLSFLLDIYITPFIAIKAKYGGGNYKELNEACWEGELHFDHYQGDIINGMRDGNGTFCFADGSFYTGMWKANKPCGIGLFHYTDGKYDAGLYLDGFLNGYGRAQYSNGDVYEGYFKKGDMNGLGLYYQSEAKSWIFGHFAGNRLSEQISKLEGETDISFSNNLRKPQTVGTLEREYMQMLIRKSTPMKQLEQNLGSEKRQGQEDLQSQKKDLGLEKAKKGSEAGRVNRALNFEEIEERKRNKPTEGEVEDSDNGEERIHTIHDSVAGLSKKPSTKLLESKAVNEKGEEKCIIL